MNPFVPILTDKFTVHANMDKVALIHETPLYHVGRRINMYTSTGYLFDSAGYEHEELLFGLAESAKFQRATIIFDNPESPYDENKRHYCTGYINFKEIPFFVQQKGINSPFEGEHLIFLFSGSPNIVRASISHLPKI